MKKEIFLSNTQIFDTFKQSFKVLIKNFWFLILVTVLLLVLTSLADETILRYIISSEISIIFISIFYSFLIATPIGIGYLWIVHNLTQGNKSNIGDIFSVFKRNYLNAILASLLVSILIVVGFILLIIPGIYLTVKLFFVNLFIVDKKMGPIEAIEASWNLTNGYFWKILGLGLLFIPILIGGALLLLVGLLPAIAWISSSQAVMYNSLLNIKE